MGLPSFHSGYPAFFGKNAFLGLPSFHSGYPAFLQKCFYGIAFISFRLSRIFDKKMAERAGFEPAVRFPLRQFSKLLLSATQPPLRFGAPLQSALHQTLYIIATELFRAADAELVSQRDVSGAVFAGQIAQKFFPQRNHRQQTTAGAVVFFVGTQVFGQFGNARGQNRDLHFRGSGITLFAGIFLDDFLFYSFVHFPVLLSFNRASASGGTGQSVTAPIGALEYNIAHLS